MNWQIYPLPLDEKFITSLKEKPVTDSLKGIFFKGEFNLTETGYTYFDLGNYTKGVVYINGHNLGRYWNVGPQFRLYCPASWLKKGANEIIVFDLLQQQAAAIKSIKAMDWK